MKKNTDIDLVVQPQGTSHGEVWEKATLIMMDSMSEAIELIRAKPVPSSYERYDQMITFQTHVDECLHEIEHGNQAISDQISEKAKKWKDLTLEIEPSLDIKRSWKTSENADVWDSGKIAEGDPEPCFNRAKQTDQVNEGCAGGAYRIIINTDVSWYASPVDGAAIMGALCLVLQNYAPCEIYIQQGWGGRGSPNDGVTLIPAFKGEIFDPVLLSFWTGSEYKDNVFSEYLNRGILKRLGSGTCAVPQIPCDLFVGSFHLPKPCRDEVAAEFLADVLKQILFDQRTGNVVWGRRNAK